MKEPEILILDEACAHLDMKNREYLLDIIDGFCRQKNSPMVLFISQRIEDLLPVFEHGMIIKNGRI